MKILCRFYITLFLDLCISCGKLVNPWKLKGCGKAFFSVNLNPNLRSELPSHEKYYRHTGPKVVLRCGCNMVTFNISSPQTLERRTLILLPFLQASNAALETCFLIRICQIFIFCSNCWRIWSFSPWLPSLLPPQLESPPPSSSEDGLSYTEELEYLVLGSEIIPSELLVSMVEFDL